jgi:large subunit ribosomal protein L25
MHENAPILNVETRERLGSRYCRRLRDAGKLPGVVYGHKQEPVSITLNAKQALDLITKGEKVFRLDFPGTKQTDEGQMVLLKDLQFDYLGTNVVHADFARVDLNERVTTRVPLHLIGEAPGLKQAGAILMHPVNEIEVECLVLEIPDSIEVSIGELTVGHSITAADVKLPNANMKLVTDPHTIVAQIIVQLEAPTAEATAAAGGPAEPEVLTAKKPAEGDAAKKDAAAKPGAAPAAKKDEKKK